MHDGLKILCGAGATMLLAWAVHGPFGQGKAYVDDLQVRAQAALALQGIGDVRVQFPHDPLMRTAYLTGPASLVRQSDALAIVRTIAGAPHAQWGEGNVALADAGPSIAAAPKAAAPAATTASPTATPIVPVAYSAVPAGRPSTPDPVATPAPKPVAPPPPKIVAAAAPMPISSNPCQQAVNGAIAGRVVSFQPGSAWLNATSLAIIRDVAASLKRCKGYALAIGGHTDNLGDEGVNQIMSAERAKRVRDGLIAKGVPGAALSAQGYGSTRPIQPGKAADPANRRISFIVAKGTV